jgi:hypothetical protein
MVFSDDLFARNGSNVYTKFKGATSFWQHCGEDDLKLPRGKGRMDPVLRLYKGCRVMLPCNFNVKKGKANGTQAVVEEIVLKQGSAPRDVTMHNVGKVKSVRASQVKHIDRRHLNTRISSQVFHLAPTQRTFKAKVLKPPSLMLRPNDREVIQMKGVQLPVVVNNATTRHKLHGSGVDTLFVHSWSYVTNWVYVMLLTVRTLDGLFIRIPLSDNLPKYAMSPKLLQTINSFKTKNSPTMWTEDEYDEIFNLD